MTQVITGIVLCLIPFSIASWVWLSPLAFVPVPWPDDSAFYFVAQEFFQWPPRWVMLPQAPFEPTYRIWNFNTMPLYPLLIGIGRWIGIDGSHLLKLWPLGFWAASGALLVGVLNRAGLPFLACVAIALVSALDPIGRWASVLVRPESFIGLCGVALILGLTLGFPKKVLKWEPVAVLLALSAYAHFNAIHLLFPVIAIYITHPKRLLQIGLRTALYLSPWLITVLLHPRLFIHQMQLQWNRLAVSNSWLHTPDHGLTSLFQELGSPEPWPPQIKWAAIAMSALLWVALLWGIVVPLLTPKKTLSLTPAAAWILGACWLWHTKPEAWFVFYIHIALWTFCGIAALLFFRLWKQGDLLASQFGMSLLAGLILPCIGIFAYTDIRQAHRLGKSTSWNWNTYHEFVDCIDQRLSLLEKELKDPKPFRVWDPTFPDITIELSRRHPHWEFTRTNDFYQRADLAVQHGWETEAVVVTETLNWAERDLSGSLWDYPEIQSVWMTWPAYFLNQLWTDPHWKLNRSYCQRGRWQAFIFMK